jgi:hypothetical protein
MNRRKKWKFLGFDLPVCCPIYASAGLFKNAEQASNEIPYDESMTRYNGNSTSQKNNKNCQTIEKEEDNLYWFSLVAFRLSS